MTWELLLSDGNGGWKHTSSHPDPGIAITSLTFKIGRTLLGKEEANGSWRVTDVASGETVACIRQVPVLMPVGVPGKNGLGPLRRWRGLTWVGWVNFLFLRWFLLRLYYTLEEDGSISRYGLRWCPTWRWS